MISILSLFADYKSRRGIKTVLFDKILSTIKGSEGRIEVGSAAFEIAAFPGKEVFQI
jgi:hypothetical protein